VHRGALASAAAAARYVARVDVEALTIASQRSRYAAPLVCAWLAIMARWAAHSALSLAPVDWTALNAPTLAAQAAPLASTAVPFVASTTSWHPPALALAAVVADAKAFRSAGPRAFDAAHCASVWATVLVPASSLRCASVCIAQSRADEAAATATVSRAAFVAAQRCRACAAASARALVPDAVEDEDALLALEADVLPGRPRTPGEPLSRTCIAAYAAPAASSTITASTPPATAAWWCRLRPLCLAMGTMLTRGRAGETLHLRDVLAAGPSRRGQIGGTTRNRNDRFWARDELGGRATMGA
jgi:hypothetical protein